MEIADSARKHGIADEDIRHAVRVPVRRVAHGEDRVLIIDPEDDPTAIHAMPLRREFYDYL